MGTHDRTFEIPILLARLGTMSDLRERAVAAILDFLPNISAARSSFFFRRRSIINIRT